MNHTAACDREPSESERPGTEAADLGAWTADVRRAWRAQTGGPCTPDAARSTLVACSGGGDSAGLAVVLSGVSRARVVLAYVAHDLRPAELVADDIAAVRGLAAVLRRPLVIESARVGAGNAEAEARRARYRALESASVRIGIRHIAVAHHARDQLETMVMALLRGSGPRAVAGMRGERGLGDRGVRLIRPMLGLRGEFAAEMCRTVGFRPRTDHTNADPSALRAALRSRTLAEIAAGTEGLGARLSRASDGLRCAPGAQPAER